MPSELDGAIDMVTVPEVAAALRLTRQTIYNLIDRGRLPFFKCCGHWRMFKKDLDKILGGDPVVKVLR